MLSNQSSARRQRRPQIMDIEASGFGHGSYPIEVGVALANGQRFSRLIRPLPEWTHWDKSAEKVHGISQRDLQQQGQDARDVAMELNTLLGGQTIYSDAWVLDKPWLDTLFHRLNIRQEFFLSPIEAIISEQQMASWLPIKTKLLTQMGKRIHRALDDATLIQETYVLTRDEQ